jgi:hypothetical protein
MPVQRPPEWSELEADPKWSTLDREQKRVVLANWGEAVAGYVAENGGFNPDTEASFKTTLAGIAEKHDLVPGMGEKTGQWFTDAWHNLSRGALNDFVGGVVEAPLRVAENVLPNDWVDAESAANAVAGFRKAVDEAHPVRPEFAESIPGQVVRGLGQAIPNVALGALRLPGLAAGAVAQSFDQGYQDAMQSGTTPSEAFKSGVANLPGAIPEYYADKVALGGLMSAAKVAPLKREIVKAIATGAASEAAQQALTNAVASDVVGYDKKRELTQDLGSSALVGGLTEGIVRGGTGVAENAAARAGHREYAAWLDTEKNLPESNKTLLLQRDQLLRGLRPAQMFPAGTTPLQLPEGMKQVENDRGVFHYNPEQITAAEILSASRDGKENEILGLGPVSKPAAQARAAATGEKLVAVAERAADGTEIKTTIGTTGTAPAQVAALEASKSPGSTVKVEPIGKTIVERQRAAQAASEQAAVAAALAEEKRRAEAQARRDADKLRFDETLRAANDLTANPAAEWPAVAGALRSLNNFVDDPTYALTQEQRDAALQRIAVLKPREAQLKVAHDAAVDQREATEKARATLEAEVKKQKARAERDRIAAIDATGRDPNTNKIVQIENLTDDDLANVGNDLESNGLTEQQYEAELTRREREQAQESNRASFSLRDLFTGKRSALAAAGLRSPLRLPTAATERARGGLGGEIATLQEGASSLFFKNDAPALDRIAEQLRELGFKAETENDVIELVGRAFNGEDVRPDIEGEVEFAAAARRAEPITTGIPAETLAKNVQPIQIKADNWQASNRTNRERLRAKPPETIVNADTGQSVSIDPNSYKHSFASANGPAAHAILDELPALMRTAVFIGGSTDSNLPGGFSRFERYVAAITTPDGIKPVRLTIAVHNDGQRVVYDAQTLGHKKTLKPALTDRRIRSDGEPEGNSPDKYKSKVASENATQTIVPGDIPTVRDLLPDVKSQPDGTSTAAFASQPAPARPTVKDSLQVDPIPDAEIERLRAVHATALGPRMADLDLRVGLLADLLEQEGYTKAAAKLRANKLSEAEAVVAARRAPQFRAEIVRLRQEQAFILVSAKAAADGKMTGLIAHELAHRYWDTLPEDAKAIERAAADRALANKTGPLFNAQGEKQTNIAITAEELRAAGLSATLEADPDLVYKEYFAELTRIENERYLGNRVEASSAPAHTRRLLARLRQWLQEVYDAVRRTTGRADLTREGFREWLAGASQEQGNRTAMAYATRRAPEFATGQGVPQGNVDAETNEPDYVPTVEAMRYARTALGRAKFDELLRERFPTYEQLDGGTQINLVEPIAREAVAAAQQGRDPEQAIRQETAKIIAKARATARRAGRLSIYDIEPGVDFATSEAGGLFNEDTAGDANRSTTGDFIAAADKFRDETQEVPKGSPLDNREVRQLAPYLISGNKGDIVGAHGDFIAKVAQGAKRVVDAFGGAAIYSHFLAQRGLLPAGSQWNEWEYTRSTTNRQIANNTEAVVAALEQVKADYLAAFPREKLPASREEMLDLRRRQLDWMQKRVAELVPTPSKDAEGRLILPDSPQMAAFYLFAQNHMAENRVVDIELRDGRAVFTTAGKVNGKDDFKFIAADKNGKPEWSIPWMRIWEPEAAANRLRSAAGRLRQLEVRQGDGWALAANAEPGSLVFVDSSYFQSDKDIAEGKQVMNYGSETLDDGNWPDWLVKFSEKLEPRGNDVRYVVTNNFNNQVVAELEKAGWTILRTSRTNKTGLAHELVALSPAAARAAGIKPQPTRTAPPANFGERRIGGPVRSPRGRPTTDAGTDLALSSDSNAGPNEDRRTEAGSNTGNAAGNSRGEGDRSRRAAELKAALPAGVTTAAALEREQATLSEAAREARHPAAVGKTEPGEAWASVPRMTDAQLTEERASIAKHLDEYALDLADIEKALLHGRSDALKAEIDRRADPIGRATKVTALPKVDRKEALKTELDRGRRLRDDGFKTGNDTAENEGTRIVKAARARLDEEFPNWEVTGKPATVAKSATAAPTAPATKPAPAALATQDDGRNLPPPAPPEPPENGAPRPDDAAPDRGRARAAFGHSAYTPNFLERTTERLRSMAVGFRGAIPELPAFPALAAKTDRFIRDQGPAFYNNLKAFYRTLSSANDYVQRTAEEQVDAITDPLMKTGVAFDADAYAQLKKRQEQARRLKAEGKLMPKGAEAELDALQSRLEAHPYVLFNKLVYFMDLDWRGRNLKDSEGNPIKLPDGLNQTEIDNELARLGGLIAASPHAQLIETAFDRHMALVKQTAEDLKQRDLLAAQHLDNPYYFPHLTLEITRGDKVIERELRPERVRVGTEADFRGYLQEPTGSLKPIESDYVRAVYYHLVQVGAHNLKADAIRDHARSYDVMEQVKDRAKVLSKQRGRSVSWEEVFHSEYAPAGYVLYGTDSRDAFPSVMVDRDKLARRLGEALTSADLHEQLKELGVKGIKLLPEDLKETLIQGQRETWIVPARVAEALRGIADRQKKTSEPIESAIKKVNGAWKGWKLFMPQNHIRYEYGNIVADLEKLFSASPRTFKYLGQSAKEMRAFFQGEAPSADLRAALKDGVINAITAQEMNQLQRLRAFDKFQTVGERITTQLKKRSSSALYQPITNMVGLGDLSSVELSAFREGVTRYANYLANLEAIRNNARPDYAGAYWRDIEAIGDSRPGANDKAQRQAAQISKATFGDYGDLSTNGQYLRDKLIPFYSWIEVNFKYHANLLRNLRDQVRGDIDGGSGNAAATAARVAGARAGGFVLRLALPYAAIMLWNAMGPHGVEDEDLSEDDRRRFHIRLGYTLDKNGKKMPNVMYTNTALADVTKWFSGPKFAQAATAWLTGKTDFVTALDSWAKEIPGDFANNTIGSAGPVIKIPATLITGKAFFPDVLDARTIPDYDMRRAIISQMTDDFTADRIEATVNKDYLAPKDLGTWAKQLVLQVRQRDPESWAFYGIKDKAAEWVEKRTGQSRDSSYNAPDQQVLRNFRRAIYQGDPETASKFYLRLLDLGYTSERFTASIRSQEPLAGVPKDLRRDFVASLSEGERAQLERAYQFYVRMSTSKGTERALFPRKEWGERGQQYYQANPRVGVLTQTMQRTEAMADEELVARAKWEMRASLQRN